MGDVKQMLHFLVQRVDDEREGEDAVDADEAVGKLQMYTFKIN
jgi:hypothetical protein